MKEDYRSLPTFHLGIKIRVFLHEPQKRRKRLEEKMNSDLCRLTRLFKDQISRCENHHLWAVFKQWESAGLLSLSPTLIVRLMRISEGWATGHLWNAPFCLPDESRDSQLWTLGRQGQLKNGQEGSFATCEQSQQAVSVILFSCPASYQGRS